MRFLLDYELLSGVHDVMTSLRPQRAVRRVDEGDTAGVKSPALTWHRPGIRSGWPHYWPHQLFGSVLI
jgi:hypothetical protein